MNQKMEATMRHHTGTCLSLAAAILLLLFAPGKAMADDSVHLLFINSYHAGFKWSDDVHDGLRETLTKAGINHTLHVEFMDTKRFITQESLNLFRATLQHKYKEMDIAAVITSDDNAFAFAKQHRQELFGDTPLVFCGVNYVSPAAIEGVTNATGINEAADIEGTLEMILALHPEVQEVLVINDRTVTGKRLTKEMEWVMEGYRDRLFFTLLDGLPMERILKRVAEAKPNEVVLHILLLRDSLGYTFEFDESIRAVSDASRAPVYGLWDFNLGLGIVGGKLLSGRIQGQDAGKKVLQILRGVPADDLPIMMESHAVPMVDYRVLKRFNLSTKNLPKETLFINRPTTIFDLHRPLAMAAIGAFALLSLMLLLLLWVLFSKKRLAEKLQRQETQLVLALEGSGMGVWHWDMKTESLFINSGWARLMGLEEKEGSTPHTAFQQRIHPEDRIRVEHALDVLRSNLDEIYECEYRIVTAAGAYLWVLDRGRITERDADGAPASAAGTFFNIETRKDKEEEVTRFKAYLSGAANAVPAPLMMVDNELKVTLWNAEAEAATGTPAKEAVGNPIDEMHPIIADHLDLVAVAMKSGEVQSRKRIVGRSGTEKSHHDLWIYPMQGASAGEAVIRVDDVSEKHRIKEIMLHSDPQLAPFQITKLIDKTLLSLEKSFTLGDFTGITIHKKYDENLPDLMCDGQKIQQVFQNLLANAAEELLTHEVPNPAIAISVTRENREICIDILDNGPGMAEGTSNRIFEPFFSTRKPHRSRGMGLFVARHIIATTHGGKLELCDTGRSGTRFTIHLPMDGPRQERNLPTPQALFDEAPSPGEGI